MIDALDERPSTLARTDGKVYWIEITESQQKFNPHLRDALFPDKARVTFEVNKYSKKLSSSSLSYTMIPILENRGVPKDVFVNLLRADLGSRFGEMEAAIEDNLALRAWNQQVNPTLTERLGYGGVEMRGGLPDSTPEKINWFVEVSSTPSITMSFRR